MARATGPRNKARGYEHETELVKSAEKEGMCARRAWGSDGRSLGLPSGVDVELTSGLDVLHIQAKRVKDFPKWLTRDKGKNKGFLTYLRPLGGSCDAVAFRRDRDCNYVILTWEDYLELVYRASKYG